MKPRLVNPKLVVVLSILVPCLAAAQPGPAPTRRGGPHDGRAEMYMRYFDSKTVTTVEGEVVKLERIPHPSMQVTGVHATVKTAGGVLDVHLGPSWFIDNQDFQLAAGQKVTVTGSKVTIDGKASLIATEVKTDDQVLKLREADGTPVWMAWRQRQRR
jgi:hypothetical protein